MSNSIILHNKTLDKKVVISAPQEYSEDIVLALPTKSGNICLENSDVIEVLKNEINTLKEKIKILESRQL